MLGDRKIRSELGAEYLAKLQAATGVDGVVELSCDCIEPPPVES
jgi:hypothetical protein